LASITKPRPVVGVNGEPTSPPPSRPDATVGEIAPRPLVGALNPTAIEVIREGVKFLASSIRPDGSWPIDTNLATWNTTLSINALAGAGEDVAELLGVSAVGNALCGVPDSQVEAASADHGTAQRPFPTGNVFDWLLSCQHIKRHPFTGANPGGFGWSDLSGAVPDADDTPGALLSLLVQLEEEGMGGREDFPRDWKAWFAGREWLIRLQNSDGGWPTFCKGWGSLPFDRSGVDLTAHAIRALFDPKPIVFDLQGRPVETADHVAIKRGLRFIEDEQHRDGSWSPLWFGNQDHPHEDNPVYGTAKVLFAYRDLGMMDSPEARRGVTWLVANQNADGGWGSGVWQKAESRKPKADSSATAFRSPLSALISSIEETALAVEALLAAIAEPRTLNPEPRNATEGVPYSAAAALEKGLTWLIERVERGEHRQPAPIGFYFAKLWYYERLYPLIFTVATLGRACRQFAHPVQLDSHADPAPARAP
jgi:squalene-hopene/tetraprenyl-beta-curcumene cyclase